jgi:hypothetical protein
MLPSRHPISTRRGPEKVHRDPKLQAQLRFPNFPGGDVSFLVRGGARDSLIYG